MNPKNFKQDHRKTNADLHLLYVKWAVQHLKAMQSCIKKLAKFSNLNLMDSITALNSERMRLITTNAAYADAAEILMSIGVLKDEQIAKFLDSK